MSEDWLENYSKISIKFLEYGWFVNPFVGGLDFEKIKRFYFHLVENPPTDQKAKEEIETIIHFLLMENACNPRYRSFYIYRSKQTSHIKEYSHLYEQAILNYYKEDYISCVLIMLVLTEGVLLSFYQWDINKDDSKPNHSLLLKKIKDSTCNSKGTIIEQYFDMYKNVLIQFLEDWIFKDHRKADFSLSFLNRHFTLHAMGPENFYRTIDAHRMILFFDLIIEFFSILDTNYYKFIPDDIPQINSRVKYYYKLIDKTIDFKEMLVQENQFLQENINFVEPQLKPNTELSLLRSLIEMAEIKHMIENYKPI